MKAPVPISSFDRYQLSFNESRLYVGWRGEFEVADWLRSHGLKVRHRPSTHRPFDLYCNGKRVEVKTVRPYRNQWHFRLHGSLHRPFDETTQHVYILRAEDVPPTGEAIHLVIPSPIGRQRLCLSARQLRSGTKWAKFANNLAPFLRGTA